MSSKKSNSSRREFLRNTVPVVAGGVAALGFAGGALAAGPASAKTDAKPSAANGKIRSNEYWAQRGDTKLYMFRKRLAVHEHDERAQAGQPPMPILFLVHGSSLSSRSSFDLHVTGHGEYSLMDTFAGYGFDVWTMDFGGYGRSSMTNGNANIADGVEDLKAAVEVVTRETGQKRFHFCGESSGALRAGAFAMVRPECVDRLVLAAFTYTGQGSPTLTDRAKQVDFYRSHNRRPRDRDMIRSIFTRDKPGTSEPGVAEALADAELPLGDSVPTGTYLDMSANLPVVDPLKVHAPVLLVRGEYDGIATNEDLVNFFTKLPNGDRQFVILPGLAHSMAMGINRHEFWYAVRTFLQMPPGKDIAKSS